MCVTNTSIHPLYLRLSRTPFASLENLVSSTSGSTLFVLYKTIGMSGREKPRRWQTYILELSWFLPPHRRRTQRKASCSPTTSPTLSPPNWAQNSHLKCRLGIIKSTEAFDSWTLTIYHYPREDGAFKKACWLHASYTFCQMRSSTHANRIDRSLRMWAFQWPLCETCKLAASWIRPSGRRVWSLLQLQVDLDCDGL